MKKKILLPIDSFENQILETIENNPVSIIVAETGAGKSTRVPQFLLEYTDYQIVVTQPRRVAAKAVAKRVAEEMDCPFGGLVGFRTAVDRKDSPETRCLFATDGLQLVRELTNAKASMGKGICLVIDEVHEWNLNIETLVAWTKRHILSGADIKVVLMSATLDYERLSEFFDDAPVVQVPGRCFPVVGSPTHADGIIQKSAGSMLAEIKRLIAEGANSLVFLPGKGEIKQIENSLKQTNLNAIILPLHGDVLPEEQELAFKSFAQPKVVLATNIAQTSLTIPDIDAVVDSGLERRLELVNGVETLLLGNISRADCRQRAGRAGRVKEGQYVLCNDTEYDSFADYPVPEIQRSLLDQMVLRLASAGLDALELPFYHQPEKQTLVDAKELLYAVEAVDQEGNITKLGRDINRFPVNVASARMMLEALERKCLAPILSIVAVMGTRYSSIRRKQRDNDPDGWMSWEELLDPKKEYKSDLLVEYDLFKIARAMKDKKWLASHGVDPKGFETAMEIREQVKTAIRNLGYHEKDHSVNKTNEEEILKCIASGMLVHLYKHSGNGDYQNGGTRTLARESILQKLSQNPNWIVGEPMNINITNRRGRPQTIPLVKTCTAVNPLWFVELAPHLVEQKIENLRFDSEKMGMIEDRVVIFNSTEIAREKKLAEYRPEVLDKFAYALANNSFSSDCAWRKISDANKTDLKRYEELRVRSGGTIEKLDSVFLSNRYNEILAKALEGKEIKNLSMYVIEVILGGLGSLWLPLNSYFSVEEENRIMRENPDLVEINGQKFPVIYSETSTCHHAKIAVTEKFIQETDPEQLVLPSGREIAVSYDGVSGGPSKMRSLLHSRMVDSFKSTILQFVTVPQEEPFMNNNWGWKITELGQSLKNNLEKIQAEVIQKLTFDNQAELIEETKTKAEELKNNLRAEYKAEYEKANSLIIQTEESFEKTLVEAEADAEFIPEELRDIRNQFIEAKSLLEKGEFAKVNNFCQEMENTIAGLQNLDNIPVHLLTAFGGNINRVMQFMENVKNLPTEKLDVHIIGACGRARVSAHLEALGGPDFFCGADPNDVKYYVYEYHFGDGGYEEPMSVAVLKNRQNSNQSKSWQDNVGSSNSALAEALRQAGLVD
ncbi:MAG: helicase-related protein [Patescibacteria group bacterium]